MNKKKILSDLEEGFIERKFNKEEMANRVVEAVLGKEWVEDPTEQAPNRWTDTETEEHRYQEAKPDSIEGGEDEELTNDEWAESFDINSVVEMVSLEDAGVEGGGSAEYMHIGELADGSRSFITEYGDDAMPELNRDKQLIGYEYMNAVLPDMVPAHATADDGSWVATEEINGWEMSEAPDEALDNLNFDEFVTGSSHQVIIGNNDINEHNILVEEDGGIQFFDMDNSAQKLNSKTLAGALLGPSMVVEDEMEGDSGEAFEQILDNAVSIANDLDVDVVEEQLSSVNTKMADNIRNNIELLRDEEAVREARDVGLNFFEEWSDDTDKSLSAIHRRDDESDLLHLDDVVGMAENVIKERVYIESPDEAPEGVEVQTGERGGTFYVTGETSDEEDERESEQSETSSDDVTADTVSATNVTMENVEFAENATDEIKAAFEGGFEQTVNRLRDEEVAENVSENLYVTKFEGMGMMNGQVSFIDDFMSEGGTIKLKLRDGAPASTVNHELAHGIAELYGYSIKKKALNLANDYGMGADNPPDRHYDAHDVDVDDLKLREERKPDRPETVQKLIEELNNSIEKQYEAISNGNPNWKRFIINDSYSATNAHETFAMAHESLSMTPVSGEDEKDVERAKKGLESLALFHEELLSAYLDVFEASDWATEQLQAISDDPDNFVYLDDVLKAAADVVKGRRYVNDLSEVPDGYEVQEGPQGGTYYEVSDEVDGGEEQGEPEVGQVLRDDERRVALNEVGFEEGEPLLFDDGDGEIRLEISEVVNDPTAVYGANAGYLKLEDGTYATLTGDHNEDIDGNQYPSEVSAEKIRALTDADGVAEAYPEPTGSDDPGEWGVDWDNTENERHEPGSRDLYRLAERQKRIFQNEWEASAPKEGINDVKKALTTVKGSTFNPFGAYYDNLMKEAFGVEGETRSGEDARGNSEISPEDVPEVSEEAVEAMTVFRDASQQFFKENFGESATVHRGVGFHGVQALMDTLADRISTQNTDAVVVRDNPAAVFTTDEKIANSYDKGIVMRKNINAEDVLAMPEALMSFEHSPGPDWNEGEVNIAGWDMETSLDDLEIGKTRVSWKSFIEDPIAATMEAEGADPLYRVATLLDSSGEYSAAQDLYSRLSNSPAIDALEEKSPEGVKKLREIGTQSIAAAEKVEVIDLRVDADWLHEARTPKQKMFSAIGKYRVYIDSSDEAPEGVQVQEGERGGTYYETGGDTSSQRDGSDLSGRDEDAESDEADRGRKHAVSLPRPESGKVDEYVDEVQSTEWWSEGKQAADRAFKGENTRSEYSIETEDGERIWDEERVEEVHKPGVESLLNDDAASENPIGVFLVGPPGAGKGWWEENYGDEFNREFTRISSDDTKEILPEYTGTNAGEVHHEASDVAKERLAPEAIERSHNIIIDKVATTPESTLKMKEKMEKKGYDMRAVFVDVPEEKSAHNVVQRYDDEGRFTPLDYVVEARKQSISSFTEIARDFDDEKVSYYDNDVEWGEPPEAIVEGPRVFKILERISLHGQNEGKGRTWARRDASGEICMDGERLLERGGEWFDRRGRVIKHSIFEGVGNVLKDRRYVDSPDEVPEGYEVQEGSRGGLYYVSDGREGEGETGGQYEVEIESDFGSNAFDGNIREESTQKFIEQFGEDTWETVDTVYSYWEGYDSEKGALRSDWGPEHENSAPIWKVAAEVAGNETYPNEDVAQADVPDGVYNAVWNFGSHTQAVLRDTFGDSVVVQRGLKGEVAKKIIEAVKSDESFEMEHKAVESWTTDEDVTDRFTMVERGGGDDYAVIIEKDIPVERIIASAHAGSTSGVESEFHVAHEEVSEITPDDVLIVRGGSE